MAAKSRKNFWGFSPDSLLSRHLTEQAGRRTASVVVHMGKKALTPKVWRTYFQESTASANALVRVSDGGEGVRMIVSPLAPLEIEADPRLKAHPSVRLRDAMGPMIATLERL